MGPSPAEMGTWMIFRFRLFRSDHGLGMTPLSKSPFSYHFTVLWFLGSWLYETTNPFKLNVYVTYRLVITSIALYGLYGLALDLFAVLGDMKKMTWNLCVTTLLVGTLIKNFQMLQRNKTINSLRQMLHEDAESRHTPEDIFIHNLALKELKFLRMSFYGTATIFIPAWFLARYLGFFWGVKELPIPFRVPETIDLEDDFQFHIVYFVLAFAGILGMILAMETELAMYGILIQISREYRILIKDIPQINSMYDYDDADDISKNSEVRLTKKEVNPWLKKVKTKMLVKKFSARQKRLIEYTEAFESCFNKPLLQEFLGMSILIVALALQCLWESVDFSGNLVYQMGYLFINVVDMFLICLFSSRLRTQCFQIGETVYSTLWYRMASEVQKDIAMMIMRSQHPPKITIGKFMELSLNTFMNIMSNLYSWLTLFRQLDSSGSS